MDVLLKRPNEPENLKNTDILIVGQGGEERERGYGVACAVVAGTGCGSYLDLTLLGCQKQIVCS